MDGGYPTNVAPGRRFQTSFPLLHKQKGPRLGRGPSWLKVCAALEDDLCNELDVACLAGADRRSAIEVANGVGHCAEAACRRAYPRDFVRRANAIHGAYSGGEIDTVEEVEKIRPELDLNALGYRDVLNE